MAGRRLNGHHAPPGACGEPDASTRRTSGSEGGPGKRTDGDVGTAPRADPYHLKVRQDHPNAASRSSTCLLKMCHRQSTKYFSQSPHLSTTWVM